VPEKETRLSLFAYVAVSAAESCTGGGGGCMTVYVQKWSWIPLCTQRLSHKDDLNIVISVRLTSIFQDDAERFAVS
jgi:hypothetical protein